MVSNNTMRLMKIYIKYLVIVIANNSSCSLISILMIVKMYIILLGDRCISIWGMQFITK